MSPGRPFRREGACQEPKNAESLPSQLLMEAEQLERFGRGGCPLACIPNARARQNEKWHVHLNSPITVQENVERRSQAGDKPGRRLDRNSPCSPIPTTSPDDWLQPELRTEALIYTKHIPEASARSPGGPRAAAAGACRADNSRAFESDADRLRQNSLMRCSVGLPPLLLCPLGIHPKLTYGPRSRNAPFVRSLRLPFLISLRR
jgi:hypothetical protein